MFGDLIGLIVVNSGYPKMDGFFQGNPMNQWMMIKWGTPIYGNPHIEIGGMFRKKYGKCHSHS